jgi:SAM-dependent methyltransferase
MNQSIEGGHANFPGQPCPICGTKLTKSRECWHYHCRKCDYEFSELRPAISEFGHGELIDERLRHAALDEVRVSNAKVILGSLKNIRSADSGTLLDVGCAYGWFLESARDSGFVVQGIEPEEAIANLARNAGHTVHVGYFPEVLPGGARFDVITFNDVLEHIPNPRSIVVACHRCLPLRGIVSVVLPLRSGVFYRLACLLQSLRLPNSFKRMWQANFQSPHLSYFSASSLRKLFESEGFELVYTGPLKTISAQSVWSRIRYDKSSSMFLAAVQCVCVCCLTPILGLLPPDIGHFVFRKVR